MTEHRRWDSERQEWVYPLDPTIEDVGGGTFSGNAEIFLCSIAISLKRLADIESERFDWERNQR